MTRHRLAMTHAHLNRVAAVVATLLMAPLALAEESKPAVSSAEASYAAGLSTGAQLHAIGVGSELAVDEFARGLKDGLGGKRATQADQQSVQEWVIATRTAAAARNATAAS